MIYEVSVRRASQKSSVSTGQCCLGETRQHISVVSEDVDSGRCRHPTAVLGGVSQRQSLATSAGRRRDDDCTVVSSSFQFSSPQFWPASAGKLDGGSRRRGGLYNTVQFVSVQFTSVLAELERTARGTDGNRRVPPSDGG